MIQPLPPRQAAAATAGAALLGALLLWGQGAGPGAAGVPLWEPPPASLAVPTPALPAAKPLPPRPVDLNRAGVAELQQLPGIGRTLARRIVEEREVHGPFAAVEDLARVPGIGPKRLERLRPWVTGGGAP